MRIKYIYTIFASAKGNKNILKTTKTMKTTTTTTNFNYHMDNKVSIYVPSTVNINQRVDNSKQVMHIIKQMSLLFGGATSYKCTGGWVADNGEIVTERVNIVYSFCNKKALQDNLSNVINICQQIKKDMKQEAVTLEINGKATFI